KYAEPKSTIKIEITIENSSCTLEIENAIRVDQVTEEASGFGLYGIIVRVKLISWRVENTEMLGNYEY
ncbi:hypothetical protein PT095_08850, partial [Erysipelothrix rhusiopathiae]|nr:hypothetical protein [Erysipelothrix rhusiopathiae]